MKIVLFYHSLISDWNHGNAHFLRGMVTEMIHAGHDVSVYEPLSGWSLNHLLDQQGDRARRAFHDAYPRLQSSFYIVGQLDVDRALDGADLVVVHEWNDPQVVAKIGRYRRRRADFRLLFHDTHHRSVTQPADMAAYDLRDYDGVLAFGEVIRQTYLDRGWAADAWTWHEAADVRTFTAPAPDERFEEAAGVVWVGNWGDDERTDQLSTYLIEPVDALGVDSTVYGVRYPQTALAILEQAGIDYRGWLANFAVPDVFARHRLTVHVPRQVYATELPGIPTIRPFEALACGIPLVCSPWEDTEGLFRRGQDHLVAHSSQEMTRLIDRLIHDDEMADELAAHGRETIAQRHTCAHRLDELMDIYRQLEA